MLPASATTTRCACLDDIVRRFTRGPWAQQRWGLLYRDATKAFIDATRTANQRSPETRPSNTRVEKDSRRHFGGRAFEPTVFPRPLPRMRRRRRIPTRRRNSKTRRQTSHAPQRRLLDRVWFRRQKRAQRVGKRAVRWQRTHPHRADLCQRRQCRSPSTCTGISRRAAAPARQTIVPCLDVLFLKFSGLGFVRERNASLLRLGLLERMRTRRLWRRYSFCMAVDR